MSRRYSNNSLYFYLFILLLFVYLFFKFGLRFFVDFAFNVTQKGSLTNTQNLKNNSQISLIMEPILEEMPNATNEAVIEIKGKAAADTQIRLYNNKNRIDTTKADFEGSFKFEHILKERNNQFSVISKDEYSNKTSESKIYDLTFIETPPDLEIKSPEDGKKYYESRVLIEGITEKEVFVKVNGMPIVIKADGSFSYPFNLNKGGNEIIIVAEDMAGNKTEKTLNATYVE